MLIISRKYGRLGNRLFTFAHFIANAIEYKYQVINPAFSEYAGYFAGTALQLVSSYPPGPQNIMPGVIKTVTGKLAHEILYLITNPIQKGKIPWTSSAWHETIRLCDPEVYDWKHSGYLDFVYHKCVISTGWVFWDYENVIKYADIIRKYFELVPFYRKRVTDHLHACREGSDLLIGVHIRQGDYERWMGGKYYYTLDQYFKLMKNVRTLFPEKKVRFMICSNVEIDPQFFQDISIFLGPGSAIEDMYSLAACDYIMGPPSTFTGWASFFGKVPVYFIKKNEYCPDLNDFLQVESLDYYKIVADK